MVKTTHWEGKALKLSHSEVLRQPELRQSSLLMMEDVR
jgi:hypothetical protein